MTDDKNFAFISAALDECIEEYVLERKKVIPLFVNHHFSLQETIEIQKKSILIDVFSNPINALWSIPYLTLKKTVEALDRQGWDQLSGLFVRIPSGIKTGYQKQIEILVAEQFLDCKPVAGNDSKAPGSALIKKMQEHPVLRKNFFQDGQFLFSLDSEFKEALEIYSSSRASIADLSGSLLTLAVGWIYFGDKTLGIVGIGDRIARRMAQKKASANFFLGKNFGSSFYLIFPPEPSKWQIFMATLFVGVMLTLFSLVASALCDPLRKKLGLQEKKLVALLTDIETILLVKFKRRLKANFASLNE